jgi:Cu/Ag efflux pump CusA
MIVRLRPERLKQFGFQPVAVLDAVQTAYQGAVVAQTYEGNRVFDVAVILDHNARRDPEGSAALLLSTAAGTRIPLRELADVYATTGRYASSTTVPAAARR